MSWLILANWPMKRSRLAGARVGAARQLEAELGQGGSQVSEIAHTQRVQLAGNGLFILNGGGTSMSQILRLVQCDIRHRD